MLSMTGYGKAEYSDGNVTLTAEIKSVNNRQFDFNAKMPRVFIAFEDTLRKTVAKYISRGRVDLFINFTDLRVRPASVNVNLEKAAGYYAAAQKIAERLSVPNDVTVSSIIRMPDVIADDGNVDYSDLEGTLVCVVSEACERFNAMRKTEGEKLCADMLSRVTEIEDIVGKIKHVAPSVTENYREKLKSRMREILGDVKYDESRFLSEAAFYADKVNIDEEITRLFSHVAQFREIAKTERTGKKLDFLMQEFNREANTICSKSNDVTVTGYALSLKNEIEKVREQVQNVE